MTLKETHSNGYELNVEEFEKLYKRYYPNLLNFSVNLVAHEDLAKDIVHDVFMKLWEKRIEIEDQALGSLLFRMTRNTCLNHIKHTTIVQNKSVDLVRIRRFEELYRIEYLKDEPLRLIEEELEEQFESILSGLTEKCRQVFVLSRKEGLSNKEIAEKLNISIKAVEKHITRAIKEFKSRFLLKA